MRVRHLSLNNFRNYSEVDVTFVPGFNLILGRNGQGKTNLIESIAFFSSLDSHRVSGDTALIRAGENSAIARMQIEVDNRDALLEIQINAARPNRAQINRNSVKPKELNRWFSCVVFAPEDLSIVRGEPALRRKFLDQAIVAKNPSLSPIFSDYERTVRQRNALLKAARFSSNRTNTTETLQIWDTQLIALGSRIMFERRVFLELMREPLHLNYMTMVESDHAAKISINESISQMNTVANVSRETIVGNPTPGDSALVGKYHNEFDVSRETIEAAFRVALAKVSSQEIERGVTMVGPHRDDLFFELNGLPVKGYASHGESWSFVLSLRLALAHILREYSQSGDPVIILDDVFAELDAKRRKLLMQAVGDFEQTIVTAAVEEDIPVEVGGNRIYVVQGEIVSPEKLVTENFDFS